MINANELRIGNWIYQDGYVQLDEAFLTKFFGSFSYKELFPIPLTPDILEKCGFEKGTFKFRFGINDLSFSSENMGQEVALKDNNNSTYRNYKYLHQIQNVYFALTEKELEVKL